VPAKPPVIDGKYTLLRKLGAGGMAEVFLAKQASEGKFEKLVVIKRILPQLASGGSNTDFVSMFLDEARLASDLRHPNIVTVMDVGKTSETYYIVMEFLHGQDVRKMQRKNAAWSEEIPLGHCCQIAIDAAAGLHYAHNKKDLDNRPLQIVHRDVSPQNIIITYEGSTKIVDFGIAKAATQTTHTSTGVLKGKYTYMSPEQAAGEVVDHRTDQFALGIVLWELLTMRRLFKRDTEMLTLEAIMHGQIPRPSRFRADLPKSIDDVVAKMLSRKRDDRFANLEELALTLEDVLAKEGIVHSSSRLSQFMRRLFADTLAEEATLGLVNPDGSMSRNLTPFTLPPPPESKAPGDGFEAVGGEPAPPKPPPVDATTAEGKRGSKSKPDETGTRSGKKDPPKEAKPVRKEEPKKPPKESPFSDLSQSSPTEPTVANAPPRDTAPQPKVVPKPRETKRDREERAIAAKSTIAIVIAGVLAAALVIAIYVAVSAYSSSGPGTLIVRSEPKGAAVMIDGKDTGQVTPALLKDVEAGTPHKLRLTLKGREPVDEIVTIDGRGKTLEVKIDLP
jgi:eukaryotic-like serine/threonine-protein kinase